MNHFLKALCVLGVIFFTSSAFALDIPPKPTGYVNDYAGLISVQARASLEAVLSQFEAQTSNQIFVALFPSLEGGSLEDFSIRLVQAWKPGQKDKNNGILLLVFKDDRLIRIEVGYGLEGALTDALSSEIIRNNITPLFRQGKFEEGIFSGVAAIQQAIKGEYIAEKTRPLRLDKLLPQLRLFFILVLILAAIDGLRFGGYFSSHKTHSQRYGFWEWFLRFAILFAVLRILFEILTRIVLSSSMGSSGGRSGSGFGGGGGGRFGGGGANGSW